MALNDGVRQFRFLDLPSEIRIKVYRLLLCAFKPEPAPDLEKLYIPASHNIETAILHTCKQVHREAYDVLVKGNRFVHVTSTGGFPICVFLSSLYCPIVAIDEGPAKKGVLRRTERFRGYVLSLALEKRGDQHPHAADSPLAPCSLMLLGRDMDKFCEGLSDGDAHMHNFSKTLKMDLTVAPYLALQGPHKGPLENFFSGRTQENLLRPFRDHLKGFKRVQVRGLVSPELAKTVQMEVAQDEFEDFQEAIDTAVHHKTFGNELFSNGESDMACLAWQDAVSEIERMHRGSSWLGLIKKGGKPFVTKMAELYFLLKLNLAHCYLTNLENGLGCCGATFLVESTLLLAERSLENGFWKMEPDWRPSDVQMAKLRYRQAVLLRLKGEPRSIQIALGCIHDAMHFNPNDPQILKEHEALVEWRNELEEEYCAWHDEGDGQDEYEIGDTIGGMDD